MVSITANDIEIINQALDRGNDVEIKRTPDGVRIVELRVKTLLKKKDPNYIRPEKR